MTLYLRLFGLPHIQINRKNVALRRRKALALLAYLAVTGRPQSRERLADLLWPNHDQQRALAYLRNTLWIINDGINGEYITADDLTITLRADDALTVDVCRFRSLLADAPSRRDLSTALDLYHDDFLAGFHVKDTPTFDEWQTVERETLHRQFGWCAGTLTTRLRTRGEYDQAVTIAERWVQVDGFSEDAQTALIDLYLTMGKRTQALQQYQHYSDLLRQEFGLSPPDAVRELVADLAETCVSVSGNHTLPAAHLPRPATAFIGRRHEAEAVITLLQRDDCRLLTLNGIGGVGKTRLALHVAHHLAGSFADGVAFVPLAELKTPDYVIPTIAIGVGCLLREEADHKAQLIDHLRHRQMLIVLDNFEHLLSAAPVISHILHHAPQVVILATSTERLRLSCEWVYTLGGLSNDPGSEPLEALDLFKARALQMRGGEGLRDDELPVAESICAMLGGLPLALELAAGWLTVMSITQVKAILKEDLDALYTSAQDVPERHQSMWAVFSRCWDALSPPMQRSYAQLGVFSRPFRHSAAQHIAGVGSQGLYEFVAKSLLEPEGERFQMHPLLRRFALVKLKADDALYHATYDRHSAYYAAQGLSVLPDEMLEICVALEWANHRVCFDRIERLIGLLGAFYSTWGWHIATESTAHLLETSARLAAEHERDELADRFDQYLEYLARYRLAS